VSVIFIVLPLAVLVVLAAVAAYLWAARRGQFDDLTTPALRVLHDEETGEPRAEATSEAGGEGVSTDARAAEAGRPRVASAVEPSDRGGSAGRDDG
jgi:cbb3-type cytochrome oxidase maturation protein